jgi:hypothetical protein
MTLKDLSNEDLHSKTKSVAERERLTTIQILWHLRENERRMLYAQMGYRDLKDYCIKELKYSESSAWRRISAMRVLQELPEVAEKIKNGNLNLVQMSLVRSHFREAKPTKEEKKGILSSIENQSTLMTERILAELKPEISRPVEIEKPIKGNKTELTLVLDADLVSDLEEIQVLLGKKMSKLELMKFMTEQTLTKLRKDCTPKKDLTSNSQSERNAQPTRQQAASRRHKNFGSLTKKKSTRYVPKSILNEVKRRDRNRCQYTDPVSGRQCEAIHNLQIEHRLPFAKGGASDETENLELLCPVHNHLRAVQQFGEHKMQEYLRSLRE